MKARTQEIYDRAFELLEEMLKQDWDERNTVSKAQGHGFIHAIVGLMKSSFEHGANGDAKPPYYIEMMRATGTEIGTATAAVLENAYITGKARG